MRRGNRDPFGTGGGLAAGRFENGREGFRTGRCNVCFPQDLRGSKVASSTVGDVGRSSVPPGRGENESAPSIFTFDRIPRSKPSAHIPRGDPRRRRSPRRYFPPPTLVVSRTLGPLPLRSISIPSHRYLRRSTRSLLPAATGVGRRLHFAAISLSTFDRSTRVRPHVDVGTPRTAQHRSQRPRKVRHVAWMDRTRTDRTETRAEVDEHGPSTTSRRSTTMLDRSDHARLVVDGTAADGRGPW